MNEIKQIIGLVKDMSVAHAMSHEPFCDTYACRDDFNRTKEQVLLALDRLEELTNKEK